MDKSRSLVLVAMDGGEISHFALKKYAEEIMEPKDYVVAVLVGAEKSNVAYNAIGPLGKSVVRTLVEAEEKKIDDKISEIQRLMEELKVRGEVIRAYGEPGPALIEKAKELNANYIVTGSRGLGKLRKTFSGSVSSHLLHHSHIPVIVCKMTT